MAANPDPAIKKKNITYEELSLVVKDIKDFLKVRNNEDWANLL